MNEFTKGKKAFLIIAALMVVTFIVMVNVIGYMFYHVLIVYLVYLALAVIIFRSSFVALAGNYLLVSGKTEKARKWLLKAIQLGTKSPAAYLNYSIILLKDGDAKAAMSHLTKAKELDPKTSLDKNITLTTGSCYYVMGQIDDAIAVLEALRSKYVYVNAHVLSTLGYMYFLKGNLDMALELTNKALEDSPELGSAWDNLGQIYYKQKQLDESKKAFESALSYKKDLVDSCFHLGLIAEETGNLDTARLYFERAKNCRIDSLNTVSVEAVNEKYEKYFGNNAE